MCFSSGESLRHAGDGDSVPVYHSNPRFLGLKTIIIEEEKDDLISSLHLKSSDSTTNILIYWIHVSSVRNHLVRHLYVQTINRAMIVTAAQLASYDQVKEGIEESGVMKDGLGTHVVASFAAGFVAAVASNPVDVIKTRVMNIKVGAYEGAWDCAVKTVRAEGAI